jgi:hypothetical protein
MRAQQAVLSSLAQRTQKGGAFTNLGGDVDSMITHGQEAWSMVKRLLNVETKSLEFPVGNGTGVITNLPVSYNVTSLITQGDGDSQRDGDSLKMIDFVIRYSASTTTADIVRIIITSSEDEEILPADLLAYTNTYSVNSPPAWDTRKQYRVLHDHAFVVENGNSSLGVACHKFHSKAECHTQYFNGTTTVEKGALQVWLMTRYSNASIDYACSLQFVDN